MKFYKVISLFTYLVFFSTSIHAQNLLYHFPVNQNDKKPILTDELLNSLNWSSLQAYSEQNSGYYTSVRKDSLITEYEYVEQGRVAFFKIVSFQGNVLEFESEITNSSKPTSASFFDKEVWLKYVHATLPNLSKDFEISNEEPTSILKAYYQLLGVDSRDEYGWICEYSTVGMPPERRRAVIALMGRPELLKKVLEYPNVQSQLYAVDGLIFYNYETKQMIQEQKTVLEESSSQSAKDFVKYLESELLSQNTWQKIYQLRDKNLTVKTCGNSGSYKIYESSTSELLSEETISEIPTEYEAFKKMGYFNN